LADHYATGDVYWRFAVTTGLGAPAATGLGRKAIRDLVKVLFLAISYGMQALSLARKSGKTLAEAKELLQLHVSTYPDFSAGARRSSIALDSTAGCARISDGAGEAAKMRRVRN
jgi:hypothetical protein